MEIKPRTFLFVVVLGVVLTFGAGLLFGPFNRHAPSGAVADGPESTYTSLAWTRPWSEGTPEFPTSENHVGNPYEAVKDFEKIYKVLDAYRRKYHRLPKSSEFFDLSKPLVDGLKLEEEDLRNPDYVFSERAAASKGRGPGRTDYGLCFPVVRPDGTPRAPFPGSGELDIWMYSDLTAKSNLRDFEDLSKHARYSGVYVVLFSNGSIRKFKHKETVYVRCADGVPGPLHSFPGATGHLGIAYYWEHSPLATENEVFRVTYAD